MPFMAVYTGQDAWFQYLPCGHGSHRKRLPYNGMYIPGTHAGVGLTVGYAVGHAVGVFVGDAVGAFVGDAVGAFVGDVVGDIVGACVGDTVGDAVGIATHAVAPS